MMEYNNIILFQSKGECNYFSGYLVLVLHTRISNIVMLILMFTCGWSYVSMLGGNKHKTE